MAEILNFSRGWEPITVSIEKQHAVDNSVLHCTARTTSKPIKAMNYYFLLALKKNRLFLWV